MFFMQSSPSAGEFCASEVDTEVPALEAETQEKTDAIFASLGEEADVRIIIYDVHNFMQTIGGIETSPNWGSRALLDSAKCAKIASRSLSK